MKIYITIILISLLLFGCSFTAEHQDFNCLETQWDEIGYNTISEDDKSFDTENDKDVWGGSYSCNGFITPTELKTFLNRLNTAINNNDYEEVQQLVYFPLKLIQEKKIDSLISNITYINDQAELKERFNDIFDPLIRKVIGCMNLNNLATDPNLGIDAAFGSVILARFSDSRRLFITSISYNKSAIKKWLGENCR